MSISSGAIAMYLIGFPSFIITKPFFSNDSRTSYALDLGTLDVSDNSPAVATPLESKAVQILTSYTFKSKAALNFFSMCS